MIEYVNSENFPGATGGHYFYTLEGSAEAQAVDSGAAGAFVRTGQSWPAGGTSAVARFYGSMQPGPNSHFYTADAVEADELLALQAVPVPTTVQQWNYEKLAFAATPAVEQADARDPVRATGRPSTARTTTPGTAGSGIPGTPTTGTAPTRRSC